MCVGPACKYRREGASRREIAGKTQAHERSSGCQSADGRHVTKPPSTTGRPVTAHTYNLLSSPPHPAEPPPVTDPPESHTTNRAHRITNSSSSSSTAAGHVGGDGAELHGVLRRLGPRLRGHSPHPAPPRLRPRPQARLHLRPRLPLADRRRLRLSPFPQGAGGGLATGAVVPEERPRGRGLVQDQVRQGGRRRRAVPAQGRPQGLRGLHKLCLLRPASRNAPGQVHLPPHRPQAWERGDEARGRGERDGICANVRGQGRRLDARRRRPLENVCGDLPAHPSHEKL